MGFNIVDGGLQLKGSDGNAATVTSGGRLMVDIAYSGSHAGLSDLDYASAGHTGFQPAGDYVTEAEFTTYSGSMVADWTAADAIVSAKVDTASGTLQTQFDNLDLNYATDAELATVSGVLSAEIDSDIATFSGTIDHNTILNTHNLTTDIDHNSLTNTHNLTTDIDHDQLTNFAANEHFTWATVSATIDHNTLVNYTIDEHRTIDDAASGDADLWSAEKITQYVTDNVGSSQTIYYLHNDASDIGGYEDLKSTPGVGATDSDSVIIAAADGETLIEPYVTISGAPNTTAIPAGTWTMILWADVSSTAGGSHYIRAKWYKRSSAGAETYLFEQEATLTSILPTKYNIETTVSGITMDLTDRLVVKMYGETSSPANRTITFYYEGTDNATRFNTPVVTESTLSHDVLSGLLDNDHPQYLLTTDFTTYSGAIVAQIPTDFYTQAQVDTISGSISAEIDSDITTFSGTIDHNTILNNHNLTTDIDHDALTNFSSDEHFTQAAISITNSQVSDFQEGVEDLIGTSLSGINITVSYDDGTGITTLSGATQGNPSKIEAPDSPTTSYVEAAYAAGPTNQINMVAADTILTLNDAGGAGSSIGMQVDGSTILTATTVNGVVASKLKSDSSIQLQYGVSPNEFSSDESLSGDSSLAIPTEKAVKAYVDNKNYTAADITDFTEASQDVIGTSLSGINITVSYDDGTGITTLSGSAGGEGVTDHTALSNIGTNTHAQIDTHIGSTTNPHSVDETDILPTQSGNNGLYLTTDGSNSSWATASGLIGPAGAAGADGDITWESTWDSGTSYTTNQAVTWSGTSYVAISGSLNQTPPNATYWDILAAKGDTGDTGATGPAGTDGIDATLSGTMGGDIHLSDYYLILNPTPTADDTGNGIAVSGTVDTNSTGIGAALYMASDGNYDEADASATTTMPCTALALETGTGSKKVLIQGYLRNDGWSWTVGGIVYVSETTGALTQTAPSTSNACVQPVGIATHADRILFNPTYHYVEVA